MSGLAEMGEVSVIYMYRHSAFNIVQGELVQHAVFIGSPHAPVSYLACIGAVFQLLGYGMEIRSRCQSVLDQDFISCLSFRWFSRATTALGLSLCPRVYYQDLESLDLAVIWCNCHSMQVPWNWPCCHCGQLDIQNSSSSTDKNIPFWMATIWTES